MICLNSRAEFTADIYGNKSLYRLKKNTQPSKDLSDYKKTRTIPKTYIKNPRGSKQSEIAPINMPNKGAYPK